MSKKFSEEIKQDDIEYGEDRHFPFTEDELEDEEVDEEDSEGPKYPFFF